MAAVTGHTTALDDKMVLLQAHLSSSDSVRCDIESYLARFPSLED